jgi:hypothetical protein
MICNIKWTSTSRSRIRVLHWKDDRGNVILMITRPIFRTLFFPGIRRILDPRAARELLSEVNIKVSDMGE